MSNLTELEASSTYLRVEGSSIQETFKQSSIQCEISNTEFNKMFNDYLRNLPQESINTQEEDLNAYSDSISVPLYDETGQLLYVLNPGEKASWQCIACGKAFASKQSLERHKERHPLCKTWEMMPKSEETPTESAYEWALKIIEDNLRVTNPLLERLEKVQCKYCSKQFSNVGNLHKHFNTAVVCNKLAYKYIKEAFASVKFPQS
jgi:hypothetical protein